jgi:hypothetical protein
VETLTCTRCGCDWQRTLRRGTKPRTCDECKSVRRPRRRVVRVPAPRNPLAASARRMDPTTPGYRLALSITTYRLAIEEARAALRIGRPAEALAALDRVQAPGRLKAARKPRVRA